MKVRVALVLVLFFAGVAYWGSQNPRIRALFGSQERPSDPLDFLNKPLPEPKREPPRRSVRSPSSGAAPSRDQPAPVESAPQKPVPTQMPSRELSRVLLGILQAQGITGISLSVDDTLIHVYGEVETDEVRRQVVRTLDKGRGSRKLETSNLTVVPPRK